MRLGFSSKENEMEEVIVTVWWTNPDKPDEEPHLFVNGDGDMTSVGWIKVHSATFKVEVPSRASVAPTVVATFELRIQAVRADAAEAAEKEQELQAALNKFLAIEG
jgi:hypothetical protein